MPTYSATNEEEIRITIENFKRAITKISEKDEWELILSTDFASGSIYAPSPKKKYYKYLPAALAPNIFIKKGDCLPLTNSKGFTFILVPKGSVKKAVKE